MISESTAVYRGPVCFDAVSGKLVGKAGVQLRFTSGSLAVLLGLPDIGHISYYGEMVIQGCQITQAISIPVIRNGDNVYKNAMNVRSTVKGCIQSGFAGIIPEDQLMTHILVFSLLLIDATVKVSPKLAVILVEVRWFLERKWYMHKSNYLCMEENWL
ncbi:hypothetical protein C4D60_Mb10t22880 [Musa balbisiana]|uniref:Uncharacterized protein n=1 Tax=Musa balbisiana TaxID=52838 RepID=A0A4S8IZ70_MUSBA|nr:hypothetical protein C4D60_Mb10t22880 [Musa balbisiana]